MAIEQWGFLRLLWLGTSIYNDHLWGPVTLTPFPEHLSVEGLTTCFDDLGLLRLGFEHPTVRVQDERFATAAAIWIDNVDQLTLSVPIVKSWYIVHMVISTPCYIRYSRR